MFLLSVIRYWNPSISWMHEERVRRARKLLPIIRALSIQDKYGCVATRGLKKLCLRKKHTKKFQKGWPNLFLGGIPFSTSNLVSGISSFCSFDSSKTYEPPSNFVDFDLWSLKRSILDWDAVSSRGLCSYFWALGLTLVDFVRLVTMSYPS